jgi:hypothetical protein
MTIQLLQTKELGLPNPRKPFWEHSKVNTPITANLQGAIPLEQASRLYTMGLLDAYIQNADMPPDGMSVMFNNVIRPTLYVRVDKKLKSKMEAPYSTRGNTPEIVQNSKVNQDVYLAPFINIAANLLEDQFYMTAFGAGDGAITTENQITQMLNWLDSEMLDITAMIKRTVLRQLMDILNTGSFTFPDGEVLSFGMETSSTSTPNTIWNVPAGSQIGNSGQVEQTHTDIAKFFQREGQSSGGTILVWLGGHVWNALVQDDFFKSKLSVEQQMVNLVKDPRPDGKGNTFLGSAVIYGRKFEYWSWEDTSIPFGSDPETTDPVPYVGDKDAYFFAKDYMGDIVYSGVPKLPETNSNAVIERLRVFEQRAMGMIPFYFGDMMSASQFWGFRSAPLIVPKSFKRSVSAIGLVG